ncbi:MAG: transcription termination/antitermination protein NusG [Clostridia bacterium]|nr:transcription termination/antitermination protein NusG [Clostridia bacterium]
MSEQAKWYVIHTYSGYENKVADNLQKTIENRQLHDLIQEIKIPTEIITETKDNSVKEIERKIFPSYVLVKMVMTDDTWYIVRNIRGCTGFVGPSSDEPIPLSDEEVRKMGIDTRKVEVSYQVGDTVDVVSGSLSGFSGVVSSVDTDNNLVKVIVSLFGRETPVELELGQVKKS